MKSICLQTFSRNTKHPFFCVTCRMASLEEEVDCDKWNVTFVMLCPLNQLQHR